MTFNPAGTGTTAAAATLTMISCGVNSLTGAQTQACAVYLSSSAAKPTQVILASSNAALKLPASVIVAAGEKSAAFNAIAEVVTKTVSVTISGSANGVKESDVLTLNPVDNPASPAAALSAIACEQQSLTGPATMACSVSLKTATSGPIEVKLAASDSALKVPASVTVASGKTSAGFNVTASAVATTQKETLTATFDGETKSQTILLYPASSSASPVAILSKISCDSQTLVGPTSDGCSVYLTEPATKSMAVLLSSNNIALRAPVSVLVAKGKANAGFNVTASAVTADQTATLTAAYGGVKQTEAISLSPPGSADLKSLSCGTQSLTGAQTKTCSVSLSEPATGQTVVKLASSNSALKTPASVTVSKGETSSTFSVTASAVSKSVKATLTATAKGVTLSDAITLYPSTATVPALSKIACGTQTLIGPTTESCSVYLSAAANSSTVVTLSSSKSALQVPASVTVAAGSSSATFSAKASLVTTVLSVLLTASSNGVTQTALIQLQGASASQPSTAPQVQLTWDSPNSTSDPIAGYHVYRATGSSSDYSQLSSLDTTNTYTDSTVQSGNTYQYVVRSVDARGVESEPSNPASVTVP